MTEIDSTDRQPDAPDVDRDATRERLVDATIVLLNHGGNHSLRLADVARETGVAVSTIYAHFRDRTDLVAAARLKQFKAHADEALRTVDESMSNPLDMSGLPDAVVWPTLRAPDDETARVRRWDRVEAIADARHIPDLHRQLEALQSELTRRASDLVRRAQELDLVDPEIDPAALALFTQVLRLGLTLWDLSGDARPDDAAWGALLDRIGAALLVDGRLPTEADAAQVSE